MEQKKQLPEKLQKQLIIKQMFNNDDIKKRFDEMLGKRSSAFITSVLQIVNSSEMLKDADPMTVYSAAATAASLDLPINPNLGFAYIIPYNVKQKDGSYRVEAQFQMGYKGFIQLAQRSGQFKTISYSPVYEGQLVEVNPLTGNVYDWNKRNGDNVVGYVAYFKLINGFEKSLFMSFEQLRQHGLKYSQTFKKNYGMWKDDFDAMASKTVLKLLIAKFAPMSVEMQTAVIADQAVIVEGEANYVDNKPVEMDKELERFRLMVEQFTNENDLDAFVGEVEAKTTFTDEMKDVYNKRLSVLRDIHAASGNPEVKSRAKD
jgi:recombination protein RecT